MSRYRKSNQKIRYAVVGLGHLAQVAVLPAFKKAPNCELAASTTPQQAEDRECSISFRGVA
jgi:predicted dehydrogenase